MIGRSPVAGVKPYRVDNVRVRVLSTREITTLLGGLPDDFALLARATLEGLFRLSEILHLHVEDIKGGVHHHLIPGEGDIPFELGVVGEIDHTHATLAELFFDLVMEKILTDQVSHLWAWR